MIGDVATWRYRLIKQFDSEKKLILFIAERMRNNFTKQKT